MIVTLALHPSVDRSMETDVLARGDVIRAATARIDPGGKGVNVSRALIASGVPSRAVLPCGGDEGAQLLRLLQIEGVDVVAVPISGRTRSNTTPAEPDGVVTKINESGPVLSAAEFDHVSQAVLAAAGAAEWVVVCGSVPPELPIEAFAQLCRRVVGAGVRLAVDTSGPAVRVAEEAGATLLKPNRDELAETAGTALHCICDVVGAAGQLCAWDTGAVLATASMLSVQSLGAVNGTEVILDAEGDGAQAAVDALAELLARDLDAEPADA